MVLWNGLFDDQFGFATSLVSGPVAAGVGSPRTEVSADSGDTSELVSITQFLEFAPDLDNFIINLVHYYNHPSNILKFFAVLYLK